MSGLLIDTSIWIDFIRPRSSQALKQFIAPNLANSGACLCEPVTFELLRNATPSEAGRLSAQFATLPILATPADVWHRATALSQLCRSKGIACDALDLLIASVALVHDATVVTFDADFGRIAAVSDLRVDLLTRPG